MNSIKDERIIFYLEHEDKIKEWAEIENDVCKIAHGFYLGLQERVDDKLDRCQSSFEGVSSVAPEGKAYFHVGMRRESWPVVDEFRPVIAIQWMPKSTGFTAQDLLCGAFNNWAKVHKEFKPIFEPVVGLGGSRCWELGYYWFAWRNLERPNSRFWDGDGLAEYQDSLVGSLFDAWGLLSTRVDEAAATWRAKQST